MKNLTSWHEQRALLTGVFENVLGRGLNGSADPDDGSVSVAEGAVDVIPGCAAAVDQRAAADVEVGRRVSRASAVWRRRLLRWWSAASLQFQAVLRQKARYKLYFG